jgi:hypothetical protein
MNSSSKPTIVRYNGQSFIFPVIQDLSNYFNIEEHYDPAKVYDPASTLMFVSPFRRPLHYQLMIDSGLKIVVDNLCEARCVYETHYANRENLFILENTNWFWYRESLENLSHLDRFNYCPDRNYQRLALMPLNAQRQHRDLLLDAVHPFLDSFVWSYVHHLDIRRQLPGDKQLKDNCLSDDRHFVKDWYDDTCFSLVAETAVELPGQEMFVTEKTFKPMAYQHPFMILGMPNTLQYLRSQGFETYENLFDESYDTELDVQSRIHIIKRNIENYKNIPHDTLTEQKALHNRNHFYDYDLVKKRLRKEIYEPLLNYANTR